MWKQPFHIGPQNMELEKNLYMGSQKMELEETNLYGPQKWN